MQIAARLCAIPKDPRRMDIMALEQLVKNIDLRLGRIEQILPTLATKDDLKGFPTADDPKGFVTKADLQGFPTEHDPKGFATKADLQGFPTEHDPKGFATKDDLKVFATKEELREESQRTRQQFNAVAERIEGYVRVVAEGHGNLEQRLDETNRQFELAIARLDRRVTRLEVR
jgi:hypothetical protein